jgi:hypothetical protein
MLGVAAFFRRIGVILQKKAPTSSQEQAFPGGDSGALVRSVVSLGVIFRTLAFTVERSTMPREQRLMN